MKLQLKENPRDWQKFITGLGLAALLVLTLFYLRHRWAAGAYLAAIAAAGFVVLLAWIYPHPFRPIYRLGMTASFLLGTVFMRVFLTVFFLVVLTPLGWMLRLFGKDLLQLRRPISDSYWRPARPRSDLDKMF